MMETSGIWVGQAKFVFSFSEEETDLGAESSCILEVYILVAEDETQIPEG